MACERPRPRSSHVPRLAKILLLFGAVREIIEQSHAVGLSPNTDLSGILERAVFPINRLLAIERHREMVVLKVYPHGVPYVGSHFHIRTLLFTSPPIDRLIDGHVVFQRVRSIDVV